MADLREELTTEAIKPEHVSAEQLIADYRTLQAQPGWSRLVEVFNNKVKQLEEEITDTDVHGEELNRLRDRRHLVIWFSKLPELLITALEEPAIPELEEFDPYDKPLKKQQP